MYIPMQVLEMLNNGTKINNTYLQILAKYHKYSHTTWL